VSGSYQPSSDPRILIVGDKGRVSEQVEATLHSCGLLAKRVASTRAGCALASTGQFQVVVTTQSLLEGTWKRLLDIARRFHPGFVVIVVATQFDTKQRSAVLEEGVFKFLDASSELSGLGQAARCGLWAAYLQGAGPRPEAVVDGENSVELESVLSWQRSKQRQPDR
jgi:DNA-binding NtrC family response regulator